MVDQALDLGLLVPLFIFVGILLLKRDTLGYLLSASTLILAMTVGLSVVVGELMLGLSTGRMNTAGLGVFTFFLIAALALLVKVLARWRPAERAALLARAASLLRNDQELCGSYVRQCLFESVELFPGTSRRKQACDVELSLALH